MNTLIFSDDYRIGSRLEQLELAKADFVPVLRAMKSAWNRPTENFPNGSRGLLSWIYGTNEVRERLVRRGWRKDTLGGVAWVMNPKTGMRIAVLNADAYVCDKSNFAQPRTKKGPSTGSAAESNQLAWNDEILMEALNETSASTNPGKWYFEVYCDGDEIRGELSLPTGFSNGHFTAFAERIFLGRGDDGNEPRKVQLPDSDPGDEFEIPVTRKSAA